MADSKGRIFLKLGPKPTDNLKQDFINKTLRRVVLESGYSIKKSMVSPKVYPINTDDVMKQLKQKEDLVLISVPAIRQFRLFPDGHKWSALNTCRSRHLLIWCLNEIFNQFQEFLKSDMKSVTFGPLSGVELKEIGQKTGKKYIKSQEMVVNSLINQWLGFEFDVHYDLMPDDPYESHNTELHRELHRKVAHKLVDTEGHKKG